MPWPSPKNAIVQDSRRGFASAAAGQDPGMQIPKPTEDDREFFRSVVPEAPGVEVKPMFGNLGAFVNGNMFAGLFGSSVGVKLGEQDLAVLSAIEGAGPFGP